MSWPCTVLAVIALHLQGVAIAVADIPFQDPATPGLIQDGRALQIHDPQSGITVMVPMSLNVAEEVGRNLQNGPSKILRASPFDLPKL